MRAGFGQHLRWSWLAVGVACALPSMSLAQQKAPNPPAAKQVDQQKPPVHKSRKKAKAEPVQPEPPVPTVAPNLLDQPATPATVTSTNNELTVKAQNSSLSQILHQVSTETGMKLDGMSTDERVFGSFGPAAPREVITALLNGTSYNLIMVGYLPNGAPRQLLLSRRSGGPAPPTPAVAANENPGANAGQEQDQQPNADESQPDDAGNSDDSDDSAPPMQYSPPSITPADSNQQPEGEAPTPRTIPMQPPPPQQ